MKHYKAAFPLPLDRTQVIEFDPGDEAHGVPPSFRAFLFGRDLQGALYLVEKPALIVGPAAAFLGRAWAAFGC